MEDIASQFQNALGRIEKAVAQSLPKIDELHRTMKGQYETSVSNVLQRTDDPQLGVEGETRKLREWLCSTPYLEHHRTVCAQRLAGTCQWIENNPELIRWRNSSSSSVLHVRGIRKLVNSMFWNPLFLPA
ncbi:hypothetical protein N7509_002081 [Penicillium cosmopolitanum]|uniref:Uncharacterized protein n=1 Tax=Penicillium cosmopolitanum TaxID=1131564 RepID=A0A9W9W8B5_9EURO|nr:uncharacterized protein N7509_002081 [Penicillium cosmopolitanum]KAJ5408198.1 hypothetical protein N7509_002081 [Penicillium cosmopolitanum]